LRQSKNGRSMFFGAICETRMRYGSGKLISVLNARWLSDR
jgi:hypothetical protein